MLVSNTIKRSDLRELCTIPGADIIEEVGGGAVRRTKGPGVDIFARIRPMKGREYLEARQIVGGTPFDVVIDFPLPDGVELTNDSDIIWHSALGDQTLHLTSPPMLMLGDEYLNFLAVVKS